MMLGVIFVAAICISTTSAQWSPHCHGDRRAIVHLFEWRWNDIAEECERFLQYKRYCGVQISPPNEVNSQMGSVEKRPWFERYNPISYKTYSRSGDEAAFVDMVKRCNNVGVRIYVDLLLNHMSYRGYKGTGLAGSAFDAEKLNFAGVPYNASHFNTKTSQSHPCRTASGDIENYSDAYQVRFCRLVGLTDLDNSNPYVQDKQVEWMNRLIRQGVAGFRLDAAKHMSPSEMKLILDRIENLPRKWFGPDARPFIYQEVIDYGGEPIKKNEYYGMGRVTEFSFGSYLTRSFRGWDQLRYLKTFGEGWGYLMPSNMALAFIDNHDTQRDCQVLTHMEPRQYKMAVTFMLAWPYGVARVMSSYSWPKKCENGHDVNRWYGPPHDANYNIKPVSVNADNTCNDGWICEHRWRQIYNMAVFRAVASDEAVANWWDDGANQIAFSRGNRGFYAVNNDWNKKMDVWLPTGMNEGVYCDVISGNLSEDKRSCTGAAVRVMADGRAHIIINGNAEDPVIAIHEESKIEI